MSRESERLFDAITQIDDELLPSAERPKRRLPSWRAFVAAAAILAIILSPFVIHIGSRTTVEEAANGTEPFALAQPVYPVMAAYPTDGNGDRNTSGRSCNAHGPDRTRWYTRRRCRTSRRC